MHNKAFYLTLLAGLKPELEAISAQLMPLSGAVDHKLKNDNDMYDLITELDVAVEDRLVRCLKKFDPETAVVGEERGGDRTQLRYWLIDPIDGTIHFVRGNPFCSVMLALVEDGVPIFSLIYTISQRDLYHAIKGQGAFKNGKPIRTSQRPIGQSLVLSEIRLDSARNVTVHTELANRYRLLDMLCAGYEFVMVADGRAEARVCLDPYGKDYDFAPGSLLVQEAGGVVRDLEGLTYRTTHSNMVVASNESIYREIADIVRTKR